MEKTSLYKKIKRQLDITVDNINNGDFKMWNDISFFLIFVLENKEDFDKNKFLETFLFFYKNYNPLKGKLGIVFDDYISNIYCEIIGSPWGVLINIWTNELSTEEKKISLKKHIEVLSKKENNS